MGMIKSGLKGIVLSSALLVGSSDVCAQTDFTNQAYYQQMLEAETLRQVQENTKNRRKENYKERAEERDKQTQMQENYKERVKERNLNDNQLEEDLPFVLEGLPFLLLIGGLGAVYYNLFRKLYNENKKWGNLTKGFEEK